MGLSMRKGKIVQVLALFLIFLSTPYVWADLADTSILKPTTSLSASVRTEICRALDEGSASFRIGSRTETTAAGEDLLQFYKKTQCNPVWSNEKNINSQAILLIYAIKSSSGDGLNIYDPIYNFKSILALMDLIRSDASSKNNPIVFAQLDILLTDAYMMLGKHLYYGLLPREAVPEKWSIAKKASLDIGLRLEKALQEKNVQASLEQLSPSSQGYKSLKKTMVKYLKIEESGGWKQLTTTYPNTNNIEPYFVDELKERLRVEGDLSADKNSSETYLNAVKNFQKRHGIQPDGNLGNETLSKLNSTVEEKITAIRLNMERWRWIPEKRENSYISVNIPDFSLSVINDDKTVLRMKAIVGKEGRETPIINADMKTIVVNPYWRVPITILREDIIPKVRKDVRYLKKERIKIFKNGDYPEKKAINPLKINWKKANANTFPYFLRQDPGIKNVLGHLKFIFPNPDDIYIHDTPVKSLFEKNIRTFSSGCIRIQEPIKLARYLLKNDGNIWGYRNIDTLIARRSNKNIPLSKSVKVRISYWTVWVDDDGIANFRDDVYGYDEDLAEILGWRQDTGTR